MSLRKKAVSGFSWAIFEGVLGQGSIFLVGILLARLLTPRDFGLIGIITAFLGIASYLIDGGLKKALIRKIDPTENDYNTVFLSNLGIGVLLYLLLFAASGGIAEFYSEPQLKLLFRWVGTVLILNSLAIIQQTLLIKLLDFKTQGIISIISILVSGSAAVIMAFLGYGIWSLVVFSVARSFIGVLLYWFKGKWRPSWIFSKKSFSELFGFGYKLLLADLLDAIYHNIYYLIIGKFFSTKSLGYYTRAQQFQTVISTNIATSVGRISLPILSELQNDAEKVKAVFMKFIRFSAFLNFNILLLMAAMARPIILLLIGEKWETSILYLQLLCVSAILYPLQTLNLNMIMVMGRSELNLKVEVAKKVILLPLIFITAYFSIEAMLYGLIAFSIIEFFLNSYYNKKLVDCSTIYQLKQVFPFFCLAAINFCIVFSLTFLKGLTPFEMLTIQLLTAIISTVVLNELFRTNEYLESKSKVLEFLKKRK